MDGFSSILLFGREGLLFYFSFTFMFFFCFKSRFAHVGGSLFDSIDIRLVVFGKSRVNSSIIICISLLFFLHNLIPSPFFSRLSLFSNGVTLTDVIALTFTSTQTTMLYTVSTRASRKRTYDTTRQQEKNEN
ncbi:hypothetical protein BDV38DRAFT_235942 [Aspergillus pseudotamarii]|uniref:Uncharacterized protein n=1 Tax=Aspergillus pseudotamarii TaxID=132259 RepID=A0A5N6T7F6_ASPPS|nr:uncharacterized protein BDV38DRAFT_235942 [Aspergillus pseudotamarii]KAE8142141.1 hypothetical protein BDV38DRAFT_235942 [Aspergillus pseudotamarii]